MRPEAGAHLWDAAEAARLVSEFSSGKSEAEFNSDLVVRSAIERRVVKHGETIRVTNRGRVVLRLVPEVEYSESPLDVLVAANLATSPTEVMRTITPGKKVQLSAPLDDILSEINADVEL